MATDRAVGIAALAVDPDGRRVVELEPAPRLRGASVVKPLLFWAGATCGPFADDGAGWAALAEPGISVSHNGATAALWSQVGGDRLLAWLDECTGVSWRTEGDGEHPSLRVMVTAGELARAYAALAADDTEAARQVRRWMRGVADEQSFGLRGIAADALAVARQRVGVKCGWFGGERVHAVVLVEEQQRTVGSVVTTSQPADAATRAAVREASGDDRGLVAVHDAIAGELIRSATHRALLAAATL